MALAVDTNSTSTLKTGSSSFNWNHTCTGANLILIVGVASIDTTDSDRVVSSITYNSDAMTEIRQDHNTTDNMSTALFYRVGPDSGSAYSIAVTMGGSCSSVMGYAISYTGASQTGQPDASNGTTPSNQDSVSTTVTTVADNSHLVSVVVNRGTTNALAISGSTQIYNNTFTGGNMGFGRDGPKTPAGDEAMAWTDNGVLGTIDWALSACSISPALSGPPGIKTINDLAIASVKTINDLAIASVKTIQDAAA